LRSAKGVDREEEGDLDEDERERFLSIMGMVTKWPGPNDA
jgi:hypothetical protein